MNKKFSTLMASALLATSVGAFAQGLNVSRVTDEIKSGKYYVIDVPDGTGTDKLVGVAQDPTTGVFQFKVIDENDLTTLSRVDSVLWEVTPTTIEGGFVRFVLTNKATDLVLSFDKKNAVIGNATAATSLSKTIGGNMYQWKWYDSRYENALWDGTNDICKALSVDFTNAEADSVMVVKVDTDQTLYVAKDEKSQTINGQDLIIRTPGEWIMSAEDLNTKGDEVKYMQLGFAEDIDSNPFAEKWQAQSLVGSVASATGDYQVYRKGKAGFTNGQPNYLVLNKVSDDDELTYEYLRVDTFYYTGTNVTHKLYNKLATSKAIIQKDANGDPVKANGYYVVDTMGYNLPDDAFRFQFTKNLMTDSIKVESFSQFVEMEKGVTPFNKKGANTVTYRTMLHSAAVCTGVTVSGNRITTPNVNSEVKNNDGVLRNVLSHVILEAETKQVVTFCEDDGTKTSNRVNLWAYADGIDDDYASIPDGVYTIRDAERGEYLGVHIYSPDSLAAFYGKASIENMNFDHIPAFQWVVLKNDRASADREAVSPLTITNREFNNENKYSPVQLRKGSKSNQYELPILLNNGEVREVIFDKVENIDDEYVGYKNLKDDDLKVERYTFNYWHSFDQNHYLALNAEDSLLNVASTTPGRFKITGTKEDVYGYDPEATGADQYIDGLVQLKRRAYTVEIQGVGSVYSNKEDHYMVTDEAGADDAIATFYFKENNEFEKGEGEEAQTLCYYALIDTTGIDAKGGVVDNDNEARLWSQVLGETRTSVFAIEKDNAPLYRRFNVEALEGNAGDAADTLRFVEKYRGEYLQMESNPNFVKEGIDFLGIDDASEAEGGLAFIVDTAFVERWNGNIKPQYLVSIDRTDQAFEAGEMCPICKEIVAAGGERPANCPHDAEGKLPFHMGKYLVNFADSVTNAVDPSDYKWAGYTRVGFVKAAHMGDSLFILKDQFADWTLADFDTAVIKKAVVDEEYDAANIINLQGDKHKKVTWSFRYVNPEEAGQEVEENRAFLFESLADKDQPDIAPSEGQWLKMQNGCLVMSGSNGSKSTFNEVRTGDDDALIFNVEPYAGDDDLATDNEEITASEVTVIAGAGQITINGAAGKKVVVSNILGQVVANTVLTSDNATIAAPQGVVVVAVEGEEAVKAIVK